MKVLSLSVKIGLEPGEQYLLIPIRLPVSRNEKRLTDQGEREL